MTKGYMDVRACIEQGQDGERKYCCAFFLNGTYSRYGFIVGEFPSPSLTAGRTDRRSVQPCIVSDRVGEEERLSSGEKTRIRAFLT